MIGTKIKPGTGGTVSGLRKNGSGVPSNAEHSEADSDKQEFVLATLRCVSSRIRLIDCEVAAAGTALKAGLISPETALDWVEEVAPGCVGLVAEQIMKPRETEVAA
jgi:hypothetical protein